MQVLEKDDFGPQVLESQGFVLVDFYGDGCVPCEALLPDVEALAAEYKDRVKFVKFNTSKGRRVAISQKVLGLPTISLYKDGQKIDELTKDDATKANIAAMLDKNVPERG